MFKRGQRSQMGESRASKYRCLAAMKKNQAVEVQGTSNSSLSSEDDSETSPARTSLQDASIAAMPRRDTDADESEQESEDEGDNESESESDYETGDESGYYEQHGEFDLNESGLKNIGQHKIL